MGGLEGHSPGAGTVAKMVSTDRDVAVQRKASSIQFWEDRATAKLCAVKVDSFKVKLEHKLMAALASVVQQ